MSRLESDIAIQIRALRLPEPEREFRFAPPRRWPFDFAWPSYMVALETEGATWANGRHNRGAGYESDCLKYSEAAIRGWRVIRVTAKMIKSGVAIELLQRALANAHRVQTSEVQDLLFQTREKIA
jgi:hypothetical protein